MRLEAAINAYLSTRYSLLGQVDAKVTLPVPTAADFSRVKQFFSMDGKMYWDITGTIEETNIAAVSLTYTREVPDDFYAMNDFLLKGLIPGPAKLEGSIDLVWLDWVAYEKFWGGASGPVQSPVRSAMSFDFLGPLLGGTGVYLNHRMKMLLPSVILTTINEPIGGRGKVIQTVEFKADVGEVDTNEIHLCEVQLVNTIAGVP
jgi:hypothetical protein